MIDFVHESETLRFYDDEIQLELVRSANEEVCASKEKTRIATYTQAQTILVATIRAVRDDSIKRAIDLASGSWWTVELPEISYVDVVPEQIDINDIVATTGESVSAAAAVVRMSII